jgi:cytochrome o ubiquinol oxidase subunit 2
MMNTFYAPTLAGMIYAMPGMHSQLHAVLRRPGESEGFSANYSGAGFSDMRFKLKGMDQGDYDRWIAEARASGSPLDLSGYRQLLQPSERVPVMRFSSIEAGLFRRIVERCVEPGTPCTSETMSHRGAEIAHAAGAHQP